MEQFCEFILNLGQWFRRSRLKDFLSGAPAALLFSGAEPYAILKEDIMGNIHVKLYDIWTSCSGGDVVKRKSLHTDIRRTEEERSQYLTVLDHLEWETMESSRSKNQLIMSFMIVHGLIDIPAGKYLIHAST